MLCYIPFAGWIACIVVLASPQFREDQAVRFNAFQGLYLFVAWLLVQTSCIPLISESNAGHVVSAVMRLAVRCRLDLHAGQSEPQRKDTLCRSLENWRSVRSQNSL